MTTPFRMITLLSGLALLAAAPPPATARADTPHPRAEHVSVVELTDPTGDVWAPVEPNGSYGPAPDRVDGDVTGMRVSHRAHRIGVLFRATSIPPLATDHYDLMFAGVSLLTPEGRFYATLYEEGGRALVLVGRANHEASRCRGVRHEVSRTDSTVRLSVPRRCLGHPRWVRASGGLGFSVHGGGDLDFYLDAVPGPSDPFGRQPFTRRVWHPGQ